MAVFSTSAIDNRNFSYRLPRYKTEARMDLVLGDHVNIGICRELSEAGLRAQFAMPVQPGEDGTVTLYSGDDRVQLPVLVGTQRGDEIAIQFRCNNQSERHQLKNFIKLLIERGTLPVTE